MFRVIVAAMLVASCGAFQGARVAGGARRSVRAFCEPEALVNDPLPEEAARQTAMYDMIYVERLNENQQSAGGVFIPKLSTSNSDLHMARVVSVGDGREGENGLKTSVGEFKKGDIVFLRNPWGIGPRDEEHRGRKFSFVREVDVAAHMEV